MLVDTAVWIDFLRAAGTPGARRLRALLEEGELLCCPVIVQELLQGAAGPTQLATLREHLYPLPQLLPSLDTYAQAGALYARCRWRGVTIRSPHDCLIARLAMEHRTPLLHDDVDFERIAAIEPSLVLVRS